MFRSRLFSSVILIGLLILMVWQEYRTALFVLVSLLGLIAQSEFYAMQEAKGLRVFKKAGLICGAAFFIITYVGLVFLKGDVRNTKALETFIILLSILFILGRQVFEKKQTAFFAF